MDFHQPSEAPQVDTLSITEETQYDSQRTWENRHSTYVS